MATVGGSAVPASASTEVEVPALLGVSINDSHTRLLGFFNGAVRAENLQGS